MPVAADPTNIFVVLIPEILLPFTLSIYPVVVCVGAVFCANPVNVIALLPMAATDAPGSR